MRKALAVGRKELHQIVRDRRTLAILLVAPVMFLLLYGYALNFDIRNITLGVEDRDQTPESRALIAAFVNSGYFDLTASVHSGADLVRLMDRNEIRAALIIPERTGRVLGSGGLAPVQILINGDNANTASAVMGYALNIVRGVSASLAGQQGRSVAAPLVTAEPRIWYNPELKSASFLIPGIIVQILLLMTVISTSLSVVREKERGTMEQLVVSPLHPLQVIVGKSVPYIALSFIGATVVVLSGWLLFGVPVKGSWLWLFLATTAFLAGGLGMGLLISTIANTQRMAYQFSGLLTMLPSFLLSGWIFPLRNMPIPVQVVSYIIPARYFLPILRAIIVKGVGIETFWPQMVFLVGFAVVVVGLSTARLRRQMA